MKNSSWVFANDSFFLSLSHAFVSLYPAPNVDRKGRFQIPKRPQQLRLHSVVSTYGSYILNLLIFSTDQNLNCVRKVRKDNFREVRNWRTLISAPLDVTTVYWFFWWQ